MVPDICRQTETFPPGSVKLTRALCIAHDDARVNPSPGPFTWLLELLEPLLCVCCPDIAPLGPQRVVIALRRDLKPRSSRSFHLPHPPGGVPQTSAMVHFKLTVALLAAVFAALPGLAAPAAQPTDAAFLLPHNRREARPGDAKFLATSREYFPGL